MCGRRNLRREIGMLETRDIIAVGIRSTPCVLKTLLNKHQQRALVCETCSIIDADIKSDWKQLCLQRYLQDQAISYYEFEELHQILKENVECVSYVTHHIVSTQVYTNLLSTSNYPRRLKQKNILESTWRTLLASPSWS
jgi:hypothetical protein